MAVTTLSSREFNQDTGRAKRAAADGPVFITDSGRAAHVLMTIEDYDRISGKRASIAELLAMPTVEAMDFELELPARLSLLPSQKRIEELVKELSEL